METPNPTQPRLADYLRPLTSRWWLIVVAVVVATAGVYLYYVRKPNQYTTGTLVYVTDPGDPVTGVQSSPATDRNVADVASLVGSRQNAAAVASQIHYPGSPQQLLSQVSITSKQGEDFIQVSAQDGSPVQAARIANAFAQQFVASLQSTYRSRIADAIQLVKSQIAQTPTGSPGEISRGALLNQLNNLQVAYKVPTVVAQQVDPALPPSSPSYPKPVRNALFALLISLVAAISLAYALERLDRRLKTPEDLERSYGAPLLAVLPHTDSPAQLLGESSTLGTDFREPFRVLHTNIALASVDAPPRTIVISSAMPGEGKSTVVRNLALAICESGRSVAVVDLDLRHPALAKLFGVSVGPGMTDVLRRDASLDDVAIPVGTTLPSVYELVGGEQPAPAGANSSNGHGSRLPEGARMTLVLGGARPANPPAVLASERLTEVLDELRSSHDLILIDSAPVLAVSDTVPLLRYADATVIVGRLGVTKRDTAKRLREFLGRVPDMNWLGVVANDLPRSEAGSYGYGYYGMDEPPAKRGRRGERQATELSTPAV
jgi:Mrp family chromosome partitioning ATPase/capsular polysaccharide biosynthesis protein